MTKLFREVGHMVRVSVSFFVESDNHVVIVFLCA